MLRKRGNNEGSITKLPSGSFRAQVSLDGKRLSKVRKTRAECQTWLRKILDQMDEGLTFEGSQTTVEQFLTEWLVLAQPTLRPKVACQYEQLTMQHIIPCIGHVKLKDLRPQVVDSLYQNRLKAGIGIRTICYMHSVLHRALVKAVNLGLLTRNPADSATPPKYTHDEMTILSESQVTQFLIAARGCRHEVLFHLAVKTGMREGELLGLKWIDLDWTTGLLQVRRQLQIVYKKGFVFTEPKTKAGRRTILLGEALLMSLRKQVEKQNLDKQFAGERWQENGLIFASSRGTPTDLHNMTKEYKKVLASAGLPIIRFHDLRHTAATIMLSHNIPVHTVSKVLGHARASVTLDIYAHVVPGMLEEVARLMDDVITPIAVGLDKDIDEDVLEELEEDEL